MDPSPSRQTQEPALHHVTFRSQGELDVPSNLITIGSAPWHNCHHTIAHGPDARLWRQVFQEVIETPGVTAFQVRRWRTCTQRREGC